MGVAIPPPVNTKATNENLISLVHAQCASNLRISITLCDNIEVSWSTIAVNGELIVEIPSGILPQGSKESFVTLLEYAEDELRVNNVFVCFKKDRCDRQALIRMFMFLGFAAVPPGDPRIPRSGDLMFMAYEIEGDEDD